MEQRSQLEASFKTIFWITLITVLSKGIGFVRSMLMAWNFGTSMGADAFNMANGVGGVLMGLVGSTIGTAALPLYSDLKLTQHSAAAQRFLINLMNVLLCGSVVVFVLGMLFTEPLMHLFAGGYSGEKFELTVQMTRVSLFAIYFQVASGIVGTYLQSERKQIQIVLMNTPVNIFYIGSILVAARYGTVWLSWGIVFGAASSAILLGLTAYRQGLRWRPHLDLQDPMLKQIVQIMTPVWIGQLIGAAGFMVDRTLASYLDEGSVSALQYANSLLTSMATLFIPTVMLILAPIFAEDAVTSPEQLISSYSRSLRYLLLLITPLTVGAIALAEPLVRICYGYGAFTEADMPATTTAMFFYAAQVFLFGVLYEITNRAFISLKDTQTPLKISMVTLGVDIVLNLLLVRIMGLAGLALSTTIGTLLWVVAGMWLLRRRLGYLGGKEILRSGLWALGASLLMIVPIVALNNLFFPQVAARLFRMLLLFAEVGLGALIYALILNFSGLSEVIQIKGLLWKQTRRMLGIVIPHFRG